MAQIDLYRQNKVSVRVRIIDPDFASQDRIERHKYVWKYLDSLDDESLSDITVADSPDTRRNREVFRQFRVRGPCPVENLKDPNRSR